MSSAIPGSTKGLTVKEELDRLIEVRKGINVDMEEHINILKSENSTMSSPLVTYDGFPRSDIDVYRVRTSRQAIIRLRNDLNEIEAEMGRVVNLGFEGVQRAEKEEEEDAEDPELDWAEVSIVEKGSPSDEAGLRFKDRIYRFGGITLAPGGVSRDLLPQVSTLVQRATQNREPIYLLLHRGEQKEKVRVRLAPRTGWGGRGALGCLIVPI
ncbi:hypothetical protein BT69DRAFT_1280424 [Atractiella rhizophila]|nr:hypothetical protein BT69DRAFT_1282197 [Atractiella rhizophila]KAH8924643.1 hypothetical protein BT69DRAFT_1280424 [Atractiella rhizophila]